MSDLIDRQAAIKVCEHHKTEGLPCKNAAISMCIDSIEALPSAQPEPLTVTIDYEPSKDVYDRLKQAMRDAPILLLPSAQPPIKDAIEAIRDFFDNNGEFISTACFRTKDGTDLITDWGYFEEGLAEIEGYIERSEP